MTIESVNSSFYNYSSNGLRPTEQVGQNPIKIQPIEDNKPSDDTKADDFSKQDAIAMYYNHQATQLTKDIINIYAQNSKENESTSVDFSDINELHKQVTKTNALEEVASKPVEERKINNKLETEDKVG